MTYNHRQSANRLMRDRFPSRAFIFTAGLLLAAIGAYLNREVLIAKEQPAVNDGSIIPGLGIKKLRIGMPEHVVEEFARTFTDPTHKEPTRGQGDVRKFKMAGIHCYTQGGKITQLIFTYRWKTFASYDGATDKGIGMWSTVGDVLRAYGPPDSDVKDGKDVEPREFSLAAQSVTPHRYWMMYEKRGLTFGFVDGELSTIIVTPPTP